MRRSFVGFCILCFLLEGYLLDRQLVIRRLRRQLSDEQRLKAHILEQASADLLESLPAFSHFQDRLAMEFRRAAHTQQPLSLLMVSITPMRELLSAGATATILGDAAKVLIRRLRSVDSMYVFRHFVFSVVLPGLSGEQANRVAERLHDGLMDASGAGNRFAAEIQMVNYPEHTVSARELEQMAVRCFPDAVPESSAV